VPFQGNDGSGLLHRDVRHVWSSEVQPFQPTDPGSAGKISNAQGRSAVHGTPAHARSSVEYAQQYKTRQVQVARAARWRAA